MYQSVDDLDEAELDEALDNQERRSMLWKLLGLAALILVIVAVFVRPPDRPDKDSDIAVRAENASYRTAISEPSVALRRARLQDFQMTYPQSAKQSAITAQLQVLSLYEGRAWAKVLDANYDPQQPYAQKLAAIQAYEREWGGAYLGGREGELSDLRAALDAPETPPSRKLKEGPSPIPKTVRDNVMVGGPRIVPTRPTRPRPPTPVAPTPAPVKVAAYVPEITRNIRPRYPRRAQRRGIEAVVELSLNIDDRGRVAMTELIDARSDGGRYKKQFIRAAERAAMRTRYKPHVVNGQAKPVQGVIKRYRFQIQ